MASENRFGFEWNKYNDINPDYELQFERWMALLSRQDFLGKKVLDAGCGMGRNSFWAASWGAELVVAFDFDERSVEAARKNLKDFPQAKVFYKSIYDIDFKDEFDLAFSLGVIHHLKNPTLALRKLVESVKPGGKVLIWVYSYEGNEWIVKIVDPIRKSITSRLPVRIVHILTYFVSIPLYLFVKIFQGPSAYLKQLSKFKFEHIHSIAFDQLIPEVANYWRQNEVAELFNNLPVKDLQVVRPANGMGWTALGIKE